LIFLKSLKLFIKLWIIIHFSIKFTKRFQWMLIRLKFTSMVLHAFPQWSVILINLKCIFNKFFFLINVNMINLCVSIEQMLLVGHWAPVFRDLSSCAVVGPARFLIQDVFLSALFVYKYRQFVVQGAYFWSVWYK
jgi:hypothetical protein